MDPVGSVSVVIPTVFSLMTDGFRSRNVLLGNTDPNPSATHFGTTRRAKRNTDPKSIATDFGTTHRAERNTDPKSILR